MTEQTNRFYFRTKSVSAERMAAGAQTGYQVRNEEGKCAARNKFCRADWVRHGGKTAFILGGKDIECAFEKEISNQDWVLNKNQKRKKSLSRSVVRKKLAAQEEMKR